MESASRKCIYSMLIISKWSPPPIFNGGRKLQKRLKRPNFSQKHFIVVHNVKDTESRNNASTVDHIRPVLSLKFKPTITTCFALPSKITKIRGGYKNLRKGPVLHVPFSPVSLSISPLLPLELGSLKPARRSGGAL